MTNPEKLGRIDIKTSGERPLIKLWGIVDAEDIINKLEEVHADPREKEAIVKGWERIARFSSTGGVMTSGGILHDLQTPESLSVRRNIRIYEIGIDFIPSLGFVPTQGGSVNLVSSTYKELPGIRRGFGQFMHTTYEDEGIADGRYTVDPDAIAQQALLSLAVSQGRGRIEAA